MLESIESQDPGSANATNETTPPRDDMCKELPIPVSIAVGSSSAQADSGPNENADDATDSKVLPESAGGTPLLGGVPSNHTMTMRHVPVMQPSGLPMFQPMATSHAPISPLPLLFPAPPAPVTHNLIPPHLQSLPLVPPASFHLHGTPGNEPALILSGSGCNDPGLTVQDCPMVIPVYNGVNPNYPGLRLLNASPPIFGVDNFLSPHECDFLIHAASDSFGPAPVVGRGSGEVSPSRTSSTCYLAREDLPDYMRKVSLLTGKPMEHCELPQVGRYLPSQQYLQHFDAFDLSNEDGRRFALNGGQRTVTVLVYLNDVGQGGQTSFPALNLQVQPRRGMAIVFFPATVNGLLDKMALHAALPAVDVKYVSQVWIRQGNYRGQPSKRLPQTLGVPFHHLAPMMGLPFVPY